MKEGKVSPRCLQQPWQSAACMDTVCQVFQHPLPPLVPARNSCLSITDKMNEVYERGMEQSGTRSPAGLEDVKAKQHNWNEILVVLKSVAKCLLPSPGTGICPCRWVLWNRRENASMWNSWVWMFEVTGEFEPGVFYLHLIQRNRMNSIIYFTILITLSRYLLLLVFNIFMYI